MSNNTVPFAELANSVLNQLKSQKYMDSTLVIYRRIYSRIHAFLNEHGTDVYTHEFGKAFVESAKVCKSTLVTYACVVRRLDDYIDGKPYRCHHDSPKHTVPEDFAGILSKYLTKCEEGGNKSATISAKERACSIFLYRIALEGCFALSEIDAGMVTRSLLGVSNKNDFAHIRQFLKYIADVGIARIDLSGIVPRYKRPIPIPTVYTPQEISRMEGSINTSTESGKRNLAIIRLAARMGIRAGDIAKLKISEIDFDNGYLSIIQEKTEVPLSLQMPCEVSEALASHLENDKYSSEDGYVFHSMTAPYGRITTSIIRHAINECFDAAKVCTIGKKHGPHSLRSSLASSMINDDVSYDVVRRILGHTDPDVIKHYAKADIEKLRLCSIDPPEASGQFLEFLSGKKVI